MLVDAQNACNAVLKKLEFSQDKLMQATFAVEYYQGRAFLNKSQLALIGSNFSELEAMAVKNAIAEDPILHNASLVLVEI